MALDFGVYLYLLGFFFGVFAIGFLWGRFMLGVKQIFDTSIG